MPDFASFNVKSRSSSPDNKHDLEDSTSEERNANSISPQRAKQPNTLLSIELNQQQSNQTPNQSIPISKKSVSQSAEQIPSLQSEDLSSISVETKSYSPKDSRCPPIKSISKRRSRRSITQAFNKPVSSQKSIKKTRLNSTKIYRNSLDLQNPETSSMSTVSVDSESSIENIQKLIADLTALDNTNPVNSSQNKYSQLIQSDKYDSDPKNNSKHTQKYFNPTILGRDEDEFYQTRFKSIVRRYLPDDYSIDVPTAPVMTRSNRNSLSCSHQNCGYCYCFKMYVVTTLMLAIIIYLIDPCFWLSHHSNKPSNNSTQLSSGLPNEIHIHDKSTFSNERIISQKIIHFTSMFTTEVWHTKMNELYAQSNFQKAKVEEAVEFCDFKFFYIILLLVGLLVYAGIFCIYTCQLVVYFYNFPWNLGESILLFFYSITLFFTTIVAFVIGQHQIGTSLVLVDSLLGLLMSYVIFRNHSEGVIPAIYVQNDPDGNLITQILSRKQFAKRF